MRLKEFQKKMVREEEKVIWEKVAVEMNEREKE